MTTVADVDLSTWYKQGLSPTLDGDFVSSARDSDPVPDYFVSASGSDAADGLTSGTAWQTIAKVNTEMSGFVAGEKVGFNRGDTFNGTLAIASKVGTLGNEIVFGAYGSGNKPIISHATAVSDFAVDAGNLYKSTTKTTPYQVLKNNIGIAQSRTPALGSYHTVTSFSSNTVFVSSALIGMDLLGATVFIKSQPWERSAREITAFNSGTGQVTLATAPRYTIANGDDFYVGNHKSLCTAQDEWAHDISNDDLYIYSVGAPSSISAVENNANGITITSSDYINLNNLNILGVNDIGISTDLSDFITIDAVDVDYAYSIGIKTDNGTNCNIINGSSVTYSRPYGIRLYSSNSTVEDSTIAHIGREEFITHLGGSGSPNAIRFQQTDGNTLRRCTVFDNAYIGVYFFGTNTTIEKNFFYDCLMDLSDGGCIYSWHTTIDDATAFVGSVVQDNICLAGSPGDGGSDNCGIYADDRTQGVTYSRNYMNGFPNSIFLHNTRDLTFSDNFIYNGSNSPSWGTNQIGIYTREDISADYMTDNNFNTTSIFLENTDAIQWETPVRFRSTQSSTNAFIGTSDNNKFWTPFKTTPITEQHSGEAGGYKAHTIATWRTDSGQDASSTDCPFTWSTGDTNHGNRSQFVYNETASSKNIAISGAWEEMDGTSHTAMVTVPAYSAKILILGSEV